MRRAARWIRTLALGPMAALALAQSSQAPTPPLPFSDVPAGHWAAEAVRRLSERGLLLGDDRGRFAGEHTLTRYEAALLIYRLLQQLEAGALTREDLEALLMAVQELQAELAGLGLRLENAYSREEAQALLERLAALEARQALDPQALEDLRVLAEAASLTASQALLQSNLALERLAALEGRLAGLEQTAQGARALEAERFAALRREVEGLKAELAGLRGGLEAERASAPEDRGLQALELEARLKEQHERLAALEARLEAERKERQAQGALAEARLAALAEQAAPRFSLQFALAWRQGYGFALGQEGPESAAERALGQLRLATERDGDRMALALYSWGSAQPGGYTAAGLELARGGLEFFGLWTGTGEYAYALGWGLGGAGTPGGRPPSGPADAGTPSGRPPSGRDEARTPGGADDRLRLWGQVASVRVPDTLAAPRVEAGVEGGLKLFGLAWSRLELAARLGRESGGEGRSGYLLAGATPCALEGWLLAGALVTDLPLGYTGTLRYSQLREGELTAGCDRAVGGPGALVLQRSAAELRLRSEGPLAVDLSYRREGYWGENLGQTFTRGVLEAEAGFRVRLLGLELVPAAAYSRIWFEGVDGADPAVWEAAGVDNPGRGERQTFRLRLAWSGQLGAVGLEGELLWRNTLYPDYTASHYGGRAVLTWGLGGVKLGLEGGYFAGDNLELLRHEPRDARGASGSLGYAGLTLAFDGGEVSYKSDTAGGVRFGVRYAWKF